MHRSMTGPEERKRDYHAGRHSKDQKAQLAFKAGYEECFNGLIHMELEIERLAESLERLKEEMQVRSALDSGH